MLRYSSKEVLKQPLLNRADGSGVWKERPLGSGPGIFSRCVTFPPAGESNGDNRAPNKIITSRYTLLTFVPYVLYDSFHPRRNFANFYFLVVSFLQAIDAITLTAGIPTSLMPLSFVIFVEMIAKGLEDYKRHKTDAEVNIRPARVYDVSAREFATKPWGTVKVGDMLQCVEGDFCPADMVCLGTGDASKATVCWVNTKMLDGESDLKLRQAIPTVANAIAAGGTDLGRLNIRVDYEAPDANVNSFEGHMEYFSASAGKKNHSVLCENLLLRGCQVKKTRQVYGLVINVGADCKSEYRLGGDGAPKSSNMFALVNYQIIGMTMLLFLMCFVGAFVNVDWEKNGIPYVAGGQHSSEPPRPPPFEQNFGRFFLLSYQLIPISLYVTVSMIRFATAWFMESSLSMFDEEKDMRCIVRDMSLLEELGQVTHVFTDKTGTLTKNHMIFRGFWLSDENRSFGVPNNMLKRAEHADPKEVQFRPDCRPFLKPFIRFYDNPESPLFDRLFSGAAGHLQHFILNLAINHSIIVNSDKNDKTNNPFVASSADEMSFCAAAEYFGVEFVDRNIDAKTLTIRMKGGERAGESFEVKILHTIQYNSDRKCMTVVVQLPPELAFVSAESAPSENIYVLTKGADSVIVPKLDCALDDVENLNKTMAKYGSLRTLVFAGRAMGDGEWEAWHKAFVTEANNSLEVSRRNRGLPNKIDSLENELESGLSLYGCTFVEDELQDNVPITIRNLEEAGIKVFMLTGDKANTALNIAKSCELINSVSKCHQITVDRFPDLKGVQIKSDISFPKKRDMTAPQRAWSGNVSFNEKRENRSTISSLQRLQTKSRAAIVNCLQSLGDTPSDVLIIDELGIGYCVDYCGELFMKQLAMCKAVVACRCRKDQKKLLVDLIKRSVPECTCLAIGDGANDVGMLRAADVGVAIKGKDGVQALQNSDFAFGQFQFLRPLLLHHGRNMYRRMAVVIPYIFFKNSVNVLTMYLFTWCAFLSAQRSFLEIIRIMFNVVYSSIPIVVYGFNDFDATEQKSLKRPELYYPGISRARYSHKIFLAWLCASVWFSLCAHFVPLFGLKNLSYSENFTPPSDVGIWELGSTSLTIVILGVNLCFAMFVTRWTALEILTVSGTLVVYGLSLYLFSIVNTPLSNARLDGIIGGLAFYGVTDNITTHAGFYFSIILALTCGLVGFGGMLRYVSATTSERAQDPYDSKVHEFQMSRLK